ncbi:hypothetical protein LCGC14_2421770 [marine sediment metagenome]|uniref:Uncharacterized protein n=1 Tax=marine sediment metagenome TaxID=412755 RepID=A0A0F9EIS3_9ZZZZ
MSWTPPTKLVVILTLLFMIFGIFIFLDLEALFWASILPPFNIGPYSLWFMIALVLFFLTWFLFFLGVKLKGL